ncbi:MAG: hypothetical protein IT367_18125 [Candidatus Hydrogenedentes bacterium]|nr:hypothetical protein [Candidatus Hydrogenedentota bacterium]
MQTLPLSNWFPACEVPRGEVWSTKDLKTQCIVLDGDGIKARYGEPIEVQLPTPDEIAIYTSKMEEVARNLQARGF